MTWAIALKFWPVALIAAFLTLLFLQHMQVEGLQAKLAVSSATEKTATDQLKQQNADIKNMAAEGKALADTNAKNVADAITAAQEGRTAASHQVAVISKAKPGPDACVSALDLIHGAAQ